MIVLAFVVGFGLGLSFLRLMLYVAALIADPRVVLDFNMATAALLNEFRRVDE